MKFFKKNSFIIFLISLILLLEYFSSFTQSFLRYDRNAIVDGELWRLLSGHVVHGGWEHLFLNIFALIIVWVLFRKFISISKWWLFTTISAVGISVMLFIFMKQLEWYVGLSGVLHSMIVFGSIAAIIYGRKEFYILLLFVLIKIIFEQYNSSISSFIYEKIIVFNAHMYGMIIGFIIGGVSIYLNKIKNN